MRSYLTMLLFGAASLTGCDDALSGGCTSEFRVLTATVVDSGLQAVQDAALLAILVRTGDTLARPTPSPSPLGLYPIADDSWLGTIQPVGESVRVRVDHGPDSLAAAYLIGAPTRCHLTKLSGPDTLIVP